MTGNVRMPNQGLAVVFVVSSVQRHIYYLSWDILRAQAPLRAGFVHRWLPQKRLISVKGESPRCEAAAAMYYSFPE